MWYWNNIQDEDICSGIQDFNKAPQGYCPPLFDKGVKDIIGK